MYIKVLRTVYAGCKHVFDSTELACLALHIAHLKGWVCVRERVCMGVCVRESVCICVRERVCMCMYKA